MSEGKVSSKVSSFVDLRTWQKAKDFSVGIYKLTKTFPADEKFGLTSQMRRSAVSVAANIAEGFSRATASDKTHFYRMGLGSLTETQSHVYIAAELGFINKTSCDVLVERSTVISKMLNGMIKTAKGRNT